MCILEVKLFISTSTYTNSMLSLSILIINLEQFSVSLYFQQ